MLKNQISETVGFGLEWFYVHSSDPLWQPPNHIHRSYLVLHFFLSTFLCFVFRTIMADHPRDQFANKVEYFLTALSYAVGLGNVWR